MFSRDEAQKHLHAKISVWYRPLTPYFNISKICVYRGVHYLFYFALKHRVWVVVQIEPAHISASYVYSQLCFVQKKTTLNLKTDIILAGKSLLYIA